MNLVYDASYLLIELACICEVFISSRTLEFVELIRI